MRCRLGISMLALAGCGPAVTMDEDANANPQREAVECGPAADAKLVASATITDESARLALTADHLVVLTHDEAWTMPRCGSILTRVGDMAGWAPYVATDDARVFWVDWSDDSVRALDPTAGTITTLAVLDGSLEEIAVGATSVFVALHYAEERSGVYAIEKESGAADLRIATPSGYRAHDLAAFGEDLYVVFSDDTGANQPTLIVRVGPDGRAQPVLEDVPNVYDLAVVDDLMVVHRHHGPPEYTSSLEGRPAAGGDPSWIVDGEAVPEDLVTFGNAIYAADQDAPSTRLIEIRRDTGPVELARIPGDPATELVHRGLDRDLVFDAKSAFWIDVEIECDEWCDDDCGPPWCKTTPAYVLSIHRMDL